MKDFVLTIGIDKFYLSKDEADFYLRAVDNGAKYVKVRDLVLGVNFQTLVPVSISEEQKRIESGQFKCSFGKWHDKGDQCIHYFTQPDGKMKSLKDAMKTRKLIGGEI